MLEDLALASPTGKPSKSDQDLYRIYVRWQILHFLYEAAKAGRPTVSSGELQALVRQFVDTRSGRYGIVRAMVRDQEIGVFNREGRGNQRYFLRAGTGEQALITYRKRLEEEE